MCWKKNPGLIVRCGWDFGRFVGCGRMIWRRCGSVKSMGVWEYGSMGVRIHCRRPLIKISDLRALMNYGIQELLRLFWKNSPMPMPSTPWDWTAGKLYGKSPPAMTGRLLCLQGNLLLSHLNPKYHFPRCGLLNTYYMTMLLFLFH